MDELYHFGVKGMKWGVRRYQNKDGSLTPQGVKRYAQAGYAKDSLKSNKTVLGRALDRYTGAHKTAGKAKYESSSEDANKARAEKYVADKKALSEKRAAKAKQTVAKTAEKGAKVASKLLLASAVDDIFYGGVNKKIVKEAVIQTGRAAVTAYTMARGGYDIHWYDK